MTIQVKFDYQKLCASHLEKLLEDHGLSYKLNGRGEIEFLDQIEAGQLRQIKQSFSASHVSIITDKKTILIQQIKDYIDLFIEEDLENKKCNLSNYLTSKLHYSYAHMARLFSEKTYSSIENYYILKKINLVKTLIKEENLTLTEIAHKLGYSSVAHLSAQFKRITGLSPSNFQKFIKNRSRKLQV